MNKVIVVGNVCKEIELRKTNSGKSVCEFTIAVNEQYNGETKAEYIDCQAWEKSAENISKYFTRGSKILVEGKLRSSVYETKDGRKAKKTVVLVNNFEFITPKTQTESVQATESGIGNNRDAKDVRPEKEISFDSDNLPFY